MTDSDDNLGAFSMVHIQLARLNLPKRRAMTGLKTVDDLGLPHSACSFSTDIADGLSAGQGKLDGYGFFEIPCPVCVERVARKLAERSQSQAKNTEG